MAGNDVYLRSVPSDSDSDDVRLYDPTQADSGGVSPAVFSGTATIIFSQSGALNDSDIYAGTDAIIFGQQGNLLSSAVLAGTAAITFGQTGALLAGSTLAGTGTVVFDQTGEFIAGPEIFPASEMDMHDGISRAKPHEIELENYRNQKAAVRKALSKQIYGFELEPAPAAEIQPIALPEALSTIPDQVAMAPIENYADVVMEYLQMQAEAERRANDELAIVLLLAS